MNAIARHLTLRYGWALKSWGDKRSYRKHAAAFRANARGQGRPPHRIAARRTDAARLRDRGHGHAHDLRTAPAATRSSKACTPATLTSLLDIGCCRGWFVIQAAARPTCMKATASTVVPGFIDAANEARAILKADKVDFHYRLPGRPDRRPREVPHAVPDGRLLNTYHYMYWGSDYSPRHWADHDFLLKSLAGVCTDRMIFMSPLEVAECPADIAERAAAHPDWGAAYTEANFMKIAAEYFDVNRPRPHGRTALYLMVKKQTA